MCAYLHIGIHYIVETETNGYRFLSLDKGSLEQFQLSTEFQMLIMKIINGLVCF